MRVYPKLKARERKIVTFLPVTFLGQATDHRLPLRSIGRPATRLLRRGQPLFRPFRPATSSAPAANLQTGMEYYVQAGKPPADAAGYIDYINLNRPVQPGVIQRGTVVQQYFGPKGVGSHFAPVGSTHYESCIPIPAPCVRGERPTATWFIAIDDVPALQSTTRPFSVYKPGEEIGFPRYGNGTQFWVPNSASLIPLPKRR